VIDASHAAWEDQARVVDLELLRNAEEGSGKREEGRVPLERKSVIYVFNKADLLPDPESFLAQVRERYPHSVLTSTIPRSALGTPHSAGIGGLRNALRASAQALRPIAKVRVPLGDGKLLAALHRDAEVMGQEHRRWGRGRHGPGAGQSPRQAPE
jgi:50S ribosomal subunit-associated GTPase HflX